MIESCSKILPTSNPILRYNPGGTLMSARYRLPAYLREDSLISPTFGNANVMVASARTVRPLAVPEVVSNPDGASNARTGFPAAFAFSVQTVTSGRGAPCKP